MLHSGYIMRWIGHKLMLGNNIKPKMKLNLRVKELHHVVDYVLVSLLRCFTVLFCLNSIL
ncbi:hypothetical protein ACS0TY_006860 [Phlomoides rotata]